MRMEFPFEMKRFKQGTSLHNLIPPLPVYWNQSARTLTNPSVSGMREHGGSRAYVSLANAMAYYEPFLSSQMSIPLYMR